MEEKARDPPPADGLVFSSSGSDHHGPREAEPPLLLKGLLVVVGSANMISICSEARRRLPEGRKQRRRSAPVTSFLPNLELVFWETGARQPGPMRDLARIMPGEPAPDLGRWRSAGSVLSSWPLSEPRPWDLSPSCPVAVLEALFPLFWV